MALARQIRESVPEMTVSGARMGRYFARQVRNDAREPRNSKGCKTNRPGSGEIRAEIGFCRFLTCLKIPSGRLEFFAVSHM